MPDQEATFPKREVPSFWLNLKLYLSSLSDNFNYRHFKRKWLGRIWDVSFLNLSMILYSYWSGVKTVMYRPFFFLNCVKRPKNFPIGKDLSFVAWSESLEGESPCFPIRKNARLIKFNILKNKDHDIEKRSGMFSQINIFIVQLYLSSNGNACSWSWQPSSLKLAA
jgi:hypothetical protein